MFDWRNLDPRNRPVWRQQLKRDDDPPAGWIEVIIRFVVLGLLLFVWYLLSHTNG